MCVIVRGKEGRGEEELKENEFVSVGMQKEDEGK